MTPVPLPRALRCLQTGPFVDAEHPMVKSGEIIVRNADGEAVAATSRDLWEGTISPILEEHLATMLPKTHVVLQSAWSDAISHPIVPGWPLTDRDTAVFEDESVRKVRRPPQPTDSSWQGIATARPLPTLIHHPSSVNRLCSA